jgi:acyl-CoA reductase-like NAD-dependent aldehyde dehydrogenase
VSQAAVSQSIDRIVWYAGWTDKIAQVFGGTNPVAGPFFNFSIPVPSGVVGVVCEQEDSLAGFVDAVFAPLCAGNTVVAIASERRPTPAALLGEMTTSSDFPAGVLNIITGLTDELTSTLASHEDVDGIDLTGASPDTVDRLAFDSAGSIKRVLRADGNGDDSLRRLRAFVETSTVWHTIGQ